MAIRFTLNERPARWDGDPQMPLLWYLRDHAGLTGTKYGCGIGVCGACTVHVGGRAQRACATTVAGISGERVTTIEGLVASEDPVAVAVRDAWIAADVPQCGWCQVGQVMAAVDLLRRRAEPSEDDLAAITNLCRCGTYPRIREAILRAARARRREAR